MRTGDALTFKQAARAQPPDAQMLSFAGIPVFQELRFRKK